MKRRTQLRLMKGPRQLHQRVGQRGQAGIAQAQIEETPLEREKRYLMLFESSRDAICITTREGTIVDVNQSMVDLFGYTREEMIGANIKEMYANSADRKRFQQEIERNEFVRDFEVRLRKKDGSDMECLLTATVWRANDGSVLGYQGIIRDMTDRKRAEETLKVEKAYLEGLFKSAREAIVMTDNDGRTLQVNSEFTKLFGYTQGEAVGCLVDDLIVPEDFYEQAVAITKHVGEGEGMQFEAVRRRKDGRLVDVSVLTSPIIVGDGQVGIYGIYRDITDRKRAEEALKVEKAYLDQLFESAQEAIAMTDRGSVILRVNREFTRLFGYTQEEAVGRSIDDLVAPEGLLRKEGEAISSHVARGERVAFEGLRRHKGGRLVDVSAFVSPIVINNEQVAIYGIYHDITKRKRAEEALQRAHDELEDRVEERTAELAKTNEELQAEITERKYAEEINRVLISISNAVNTTENLDELYRSIHQSLGRVIDTTNFFIALYDREKDAITLPYHVDEKDTVEDYDKSYMSHASKSGSLTAEVIKSGKPNFIKKEDMLQRARKLNKKVTGTPSELWLGVPLKVRDDIIGAMVVQSYTDPDLYGERDIEILNAVSDQVAVAIDRKRAEEALQRLAEERETVAEIGRIIGSTLEIDKVYELFAEEVRKVIPFDRIAINIIYPKRDAYASAYIAGKDVAGHWPGNVVPLAGSLTEEIAHTRSSMLIQEEDRDEVVGRFPRLLPNVQAGLRSFMAIPLISKDQVIGVLHVQSATSEAYTEAEVSLAEGIGSQIAGAIANTQLFEAEKRRVASLALINEVGEKVTSILELDKLMQEVTSSIKGKFNYNYIITLLLLDEKRREMVMKAITTDLLAMVKKVKGEHRQSIDKGIIGFVARTGNPWLANDVSKDPYFIKDYRLDKGEIKSELCVPVKVGDKVIGALDIESVRPNDFDQEDVVVMEAVAGHVAIAIENARLFEAAQHELEEKQRAEQALLESKEKLEKLHEVTHHLEACTKEEEVYHLTIDAAERILLFSLSVLGIVEGEGVVVKASGSGLSAEEGGAPLLINEDLGDTTYRTRKTYVMGEMGGGVEAVVVRSGYRSCISVPVGDLGVFQTASAESGAFRENDVRLLELLLGHTAAALKRIRLQQELKEQAVHDPLTGLYNRYCLDQVLEREVKRSKRYHHCIVFLMIDVNGLKEINDRFGHQVGDRVLQAVASLLRKSVRDTDIVVRYGGDEFLIILLETDGEAEVIKKRILEHVVLSNEKDKLLDFPVTVSIGSAHWTPEAPASVDEILNEADQRMYENKRRHDGVQRTR